MPPNAIARTDSRRTGDMGIRVDLAVECLYLFRRERQVEARKIILQRFANLVQRIGL
jgi:hypothetical protein